MHHSPDGLSDIGRLRHAGVILHAVEDLLAERRIALRELPHRPAGVFPEPGLRGASREDQPDANIKSTELQRQRLREGIHRRLTRGVDSQQGHRLQGDRRGNINDGPASALSEPGDHRLGHGNRSQGIGGKQVGYRLARGALDKPAHMQALIGHCASGSTNASLLASLLPAFVVVRNQPRLATFVGLLKEEAQADRAGKSFVLARMVELLFIEAIRSSGTLATPGLMRGLSDPRVAQAIRLLHQAPARRWTVNALAADCALSRSTLFERFTDLTGMTPMGYLLGWRMTLAMQWLSETGISIADIAERIGYGSASAFSVAFTRYTGISPGKYARQRAARNVSRQALT